MFDATNTFADTEWSALVGAIIRVERDVLTRSASTGLWRRSTETACYLASSAITADRAASAKGVLVTGDALHCQGETARLIEEKGGAWLFTLKDNRPSQRAEVDAWFADPLNRPGSEHTTTDADHGRIEVRRHRLSHDIDWLLSDRRHPDEAIMPGLAMIGEVEATITRDGRTSTIRRFYLSSAKLDAVGFARAVRAHWAIENSLHWVLDVGFDEDRARNRRDNGPENLATLRKLTLNLLQRARPDISIRRKRKRSGWSDDFARTIIGQMR